MGLMEALGIPFNATDGTLPVPLWLAGATAALIVVLCFLMLFRNVLSGPAPLFPTTGILSTVAVLAFFGLGLWGALSWASHQRDLERRWLEARLSALQGQAQAPGSPLGCLTGFVDGALETACEAMVFASGESAVKAVAYTAAGLGVLEDATRFSRKQDPAFDSKISFLRRAFEKDRFGIVAHVLAARLNCTADRCPAVEVFRDPDRIRANLRDGTFERHLTRAAAKWQTGSAQAASMGPDADSRPLVATPLPPGYKLPSADSIPPVNIMTTEPQTPEPAPEPSPAAQPATAPTPPPRPSRPARRAGEPQANATPESRREPQPLRLQP